MKQIPFSYVNTRKLALQNNSEVHKMSYRTVSDNLNKKNLSLFIESSSKDMDHHCKLSFDLYYRLVKDSNLNKSTSLGFCDFFSVSTTTRMISLPAQTEPQI